jgi:hypothetical protein
MRIVVVTSLSLVLGAGAALAQAATPSPAAPSPAAPKAAAPVIPRPTPASTGDDKKAEKARAKENIADCMRLWDAGTHMSKQEWASTCERIQTRLENLRLESLEVPGTGARKKKG